MKRQGQLGVVAALLLLALASPALANIKMSVQLGWSGAYRVGRWAPVYVTIADDQAAPARNGRLELINPYASFTTRVSVPIVLRPEPATFILYAPLPYQLNDTILVVRSEGKKLAERPLNGSGIDPMMDPYIYGMTNELIVGQLRSNGVELPRQIKWSAGAEIDVRTGQLDTPLLPDDPIGYDSLDLLILNNPDLVEMPRPVQEAIAGWVRGGGKLLVWLGGEAVVPNDSPIAQLLPCRVGDPGEIRLSLDNARTLGLLSRIERVPARKLTPAATAKRLPLLLNKAELFRGRAGMGEVSMMSVDASALGFNELDGRKRFWTPILEDLIHPAATASSAGERGMTAVIGTPAARSEMIERLGDVPGIGTFDFTYIAIVLLAMMFIVGPLDWWVLRRIGRQPWTWATTAGWAALITVGAFYMGHIFRSGDLHYRTVQVIDEADGQVVGLHEMAGIYSPRTQPYGLSGPESYWWLPVDIDPPHYAYRNSNRMGVDLRLVQDHRGQRLAGQRNAQGETEPEMVVNVWSLRFLEASGKPEVRKGTIEASLRVEVMFGGGVRIIGRITNQGSEPLVNLFLRGRNGVARLTPERMTQERSEADFGSGRMRFYHDDTGSMSPILTIVPPKPEAPGELAAGASIDVDVVLGGGDPLRVTGADLENLRSQRYSKLGDRALASILAASELTHQRTRQVESFLMQDDILCIYAEAQVAQPTVNLTHTNGTPPIEKHWRIVRALVNTRAQEAQ